MDLQHRLILPPLTRRATRVAGVSVVCLVVTLFPRPLSTAFAADCDRPGSSLGVERIVEIDASNGPIFGSISKREKEHSFLREKEVVLTFDDGPSPWTTGKILDALSRECTKATFFSVGKMALAYPTTARDVLARGHTLGGHTHTHPTNLLTMPPAEAVDEIERGMGAVAAAVGQPIAPFFRFPGLRDSDGILGYLQERGIATFTVDVVSNDSFIQDPSVLAEKTLAQVRSRGSGIILFHDLKSVTAKALPRILEGLRTDGFKVVHLVAMRPLRVLDRFSERSFKASLFRTATNTRNGVQHTVGTRAQNSSWVATGEPDVDNDLAPTSFENAVHALSKGGSTKNRLSVDKVQTPRRERLGAWRYLAPPVPNVSPVRGALLKGTVVNDGER